MPNFDCFGVDDEQLFHNHLDRLEPKNTKTDGNQICRLIDMHTAHITPVHRCSIPEMLRVKVRARATQVRVGGLLGWLDGLNLAEPRPLDAVDDSDKHRRIIIHVDCLSGRFI